MSDPRTHHHDAVGSGIVPARKQLSGAQMALRFLESAGVTTVFGIPGGAVLPLYQAMAGGTSLRHILTRHEQGAGHAASGFAQATGRIGVCIATSGPGATNLVTSLMDAHMDSVPVLAITGQVPSGLLGTDAFQETDICAIVAPVTKSAVQVTSPDDVAPALREAMVSAISGRPGPVLVDITKDALQLTTSAVPLGPVEPCPGPSPDPGALREAARALLTAERPVAYVGGGVTKSGAHSQLRRLVEHLGLPVVTTLMARGAFPDRHRLNLGMPGMHGTVAAVAALQKADLLLAVGARFDDRVTGTLASFAPEAAVIHIDIDAGELSRKRHADVAVHADCASALTGLFLEVSRSVEECGGHPGYDPWWQALDRWRTRYPMGYRRHEGKLAPQFVIERLGLLTAGPDTVYTTGVGQHQMWAAQFIAHDHPRGFVNSGGAGTMGYAVPAALGVQAAFPRKQVWAIDGDGSFQMTNQELATCVQCHLPIKVAVINNGSLGMVRQWQELFHGRNFVATDLAREDLRVSPDFTELARAYGCASYRCTREEEVDTAIRAASSVCDRPAVVEFVVDKEAMVWPMVPAGVSNDELIIARNVRPHFAETDD
ncbi:biosynthetic-type acetolactate synthase large subunit [Streptomyces sp. NPDC050355]|uniref:biosynthetic-type acetolactate synthase large subunit n=1 Tax=Streptomyces sp. NPDC050355 TaxID=3365609 RepID=UPI0037BA7BFE